MNGAELVVAINAFAISSSKHLTTQELSALAVALTQLADTYATIAYIRTVGEDFSASGSR